MRKNQGGGAPPPGLAGPGTYEALADPHPAPSCAVQFLAEIKEPLVIAAHGKPIRPSHSASPHMNPRTLVQSVSALLLGATLTVRADLVLDWNTVALHAIKTEKTAPPMAARNLAILHASIFDAANGVKQPHEQHHRSYMVKTHAKAHASEDAAISAAAHKVMVTLFPAGAAQFDQDFANALAHLPNDRARQAGVAYGELVARTILAARANDGAAANVPARRVPIRATGRPRCRDSSPRCIRSGRRSRASR